MIPFIRPADPFAPSGEKAGMRGKTPRLLAGYDLTQNAPNLPVHELALA